MKTPWQIPVPIKWLLAGGMALGIALPGAARAEDPDEMLPLPQWSDEHLKLLDSAPATALPLGGPLLPGMIGVAPPALDGTGISATVTPQTAGNDAPLTGSRPAWDLSLFLPEALLGRGSSHPADRPSPTPSAALKDVSKSFLEACSQSDPAEHLIDPDYLVPETQREDLQRLLEFHAHDARIKAFVIVTDTDQRIPAGASMSSVASGALKKLDSCLVVYPLGEPWRARLFLSKPVYQSASPSYFASLIEDCANDSMLVSDPVEQLHRFCVRLSIRLFWLEKRMTRASDAHPERMPAPVASVRPEIHLAEEKGEALPLEEPVPGRLDGRIRTLAAGAAALIALALAALAAYRRHLNKLRTHVWMLPETDTVPRLGGTFCGGAAAWIQYR